jgi:cytochrome c biogenesis protein CcmG, thiol:disulfide interchange protein DsbE
VTQPAPVRRVAGVRMRPLAWSVVALALLAALTAGLAGALGGRNAADAAALMTGRTAPPLAGSSLTGGRLDLTDLRGHVVLVNVWASWCGPCRQELPLLAKFQQANRSTGVVVLGVVTRDSAGPARSLLASSGASQIRSIQDPTGALAVSWGATGVPESFLVDRAGRIRARCIGAVSPAWLDRNVAPVLAAS